MRYVYRGEEEERIPLHATHVIVHESVTIIRAWAFQGHHNIVEVICHDDVEEIEEYAFSQCRSLRRVIMPGVKIVENEAFCRCKALMDVDCGQLESIGNVRIQWLQIFEVHQLLICEAHFGGCIPRLYSPNGRNALSC